MTSIDLAITKDSVTDTDQGVPMDIQSAMEQPPVTLEVKQELGKHFFLVE